MLRLLEVSELDEALRVYPDALSALPKIGEATREPRMRRYHMLTTSCQK